MTDHIPSASHSTLADLIAEAFAGASVIAVGIFTVIVSLAIV